MTRWTARPRRGGGVVAAALTALLCAAGTRAQGPQIEYLDTQIVGASKEQAVARAEFEIIGGQQQWFRVYFQVRLDSKTPLKMPTGQEFVQLWGQLFPSANVQRALYNDARIGIDISQLQQAANLPKAKRTVLWVVCDIWDQAARKYLGTGWGVRTPLLVTTDADGKITAVETFNTDQLHPRLSDPQKQIKALQAALETKHATLRDTVGLHQAVDLKGGVHYILTAGDYQAPLRSAARGYFFNKIDSPAKAREFALVDRGGSVIIQTPEQYQAIAKALAAKGWAGSYLAQSPPATGVSVVEEPGLGYRVKATLAVGQGTGLQQLGPVVFLECNVGYDGRLGEEVRTLIHSPQSEASQPPGWKQPLPTDPATYDKIVRGALTSEGSEEIPAYVKVGDKIASIPCAQGEDPAAFKDNPLP